MWGWGGTSPVVSLEQQEGYMEDVGRTLLQRFLAFSLVVVVGSTVPVSAAPWRREAARPTFKQVTRASWYGREFEGQRTAGGTTFDPELLTAAHRTLDIGSIVKVTELRSGRSVVVEINDRGPFFAGRGIDLSLAAARQLGIVRRGVAWVRIELLGQESVLLPPPPVVSASLVPMASWFPRAIVE
jgi:rare lipoprotein A (peptidoglycan hydrolase)